LISAFGFERQFQVSLKTGCVRISGANPRLFKSTQSELVFFRLDGVELKPALGGYLQWIQSLGRMLQMFATDIAIIISLDREEASRRVAMFEVYVRRGIL
jgi:hypothetical protein